MIFKLALFLFIFFNILIVNGEDSSPNITSIGYEGNLSIDSIINIKGENIKKCNNINIDGEIMKISKIEDTIIDFSFNDKFIYNGTIEINCGDKIIKRTISFPYIEKLSGLGKKFNDTNITIFGKNFGKDTNIFLSGGIFTKGANEDSLIVGNLSNDILDNTLYLSNNSGLKSNIVNLDLILPKINFVYGEKGINGGSEISIFGENLNYYNNSKIYIDDKEYKNFKIINNSEFILLLDSELIGEHTLKIMSNGFFSNGIKLNILGQKPFIDSIVSKRLQDTDIKDTFILKGKGFPNNISDISLYNNGNTINIKTLYSDEIHFDSFNLDIGNNFFQIDVNGKKSNIKNLENIRKLPSVSSYKIGNIEEGKRNISLYLQNFDEKNDNIYFNNSIITPVGCMYNLCRIQIPDSTLTGNFTVGTSNYINDNILKFDITFDNFPYIESITTLGDIKHGTKITVSGNNFNDSVISSSNLFDTKSDSNLLDIESTDFTFKGYFPFIYDKNIDSSISVNKYGQINSLVFNYDLLKGGKFYGPPVIKEIIPISDTLLFKSGEKVKLVGKGFKKGDIVKIGDKKIELDVISYSEGSFIIPEGINEGVNDIIIENSFGFSSNKIDLLITPFYYTKSINVKSVDIDKNSFYVGVKNNESIYNIEINNKLTDIFINNISFKIENFSSSEIGTFRLKVGDKLYYPSIVTKDGFINFNGYFFVGKSNDKIIVSLIKDSEYTLSNQFDIIFLDNDFKISSNIDTNIQKYLKFSNLITNNISIHDNIEKKCYDSLENNLNCNNYSLKNSNTNDLDIRNNVNINKEVNINKSESIRDTENKNTINKNETIKNSKEKNVYGKIDKALDKVITSNSKHDLKTQLNKYKDLKFKIKKIIDKNKNSKNIIYLNYFSEKIDLKYKEIFIKYVKSNK